MNQRKLFEKWAEENGITTTMVFCWQAWQAAIAAQWQPIETAPKDGSVINTYRKCRGQIFIFAAYFKNGDWFCLDDDDMPVMPHPTHWMPLPPEPTK